MKVALVTGAGSGIGRAVARALAGEGWTLALLGRREASLRETLPQALLLPADVADEAQVGAAFATLRERLGRLDLLFN
ncbi:SDR family NAD(P)-dependent oxidoreductase, partial [Bradyrhizobium sp. NBAIM20]